jgi:hypothetical protein
LWVAGDLAVSGALDVVALDDEGDRGLAWGAGVSPLATHGPPWVDASDALGFVGEGGVGWRRAVEVFIVLFEGLEAGSFSSTRRGLRE